MFGLQIEGQRVRYWGARAIFDVGHDNPIALLADRQGYAGSEHYSGTNAVAHQNNEARGERLFFEWINKRALPALCREIKTRGLDRRSDDVVVIEDLQYRLEASPRASHGYFYIGAVERHMEKFSFRDHYLYRVGGDDQTPPLVEAKWNAEFALPEPGQEVIVKTAFGAFKGKVRGYGVEYGHVHLLVKLDKPNAATVEAWYENEVDEAKRPYVREFERAGVTGPIAYRTHELKCKSALQRAELLPKRPALKRIREEYLCTATPFDLVDPIKTHAAA